MYLISYILYVLLKCLVAIVVMSFLVYLVRLVADYIKYFCEGIRLKRNKKDSIIEKPYYNEYSSEEVKKNV